ncbi:uncharacterized protein F4822DRAFT_332286 [Hypoxylon trugodes]|uniref:uncharacterized protein n=1 Tax=Hypoxylon trugodes TaxID=326681 RepID=UPI00218DDC9B|nr:uncharacterized protein F4822DRAFT_332286 [Hypoxylon trugodes]KAI1387009.1 hypothetical protein F4822DRAFT_332286 [Hypoxylon trugodes]
MSLIAIAIAIAVFLGAIGRLVNAQGLVTNCTWQTGLLEGSFLGMYCNNDDWAEYAYDWTWFDTNNCLINYGGKLYPSYPSGNYWSTCDNCTIRGSNFDFLLNCLCIDSNGHLAPTSYDLNGLIWNHNGALGCFDHIGNKTHVGPF